MVPVLVEEARAAVGDGARKVLDAEAGRQLAARLVKAVVVAQPLPQLGRKRRVRGLSDKMELEYN